MASRYDFEFGVYKVTTVVTGDSHKENCYIVTHVPSHEKLLIDPGDNASEITSVLGEESGQLRHILLTHAHHDHVGAVAELCKQFEMSCDIHENDRRLMKQAPMYSKVFAKKTIESPEPFDTFNGSNSFDLGGNEISVVHTPGHTSGSVCYSFDGFMFTGDTLFYQTIGRTDLPGGSSDELHDSVNLLVEEFSPESTIFPGHGRPWKISEAKAWWHENHHEIG